MGQEELQTLAERRDRLLLALQKSLIPPDPHDNSNVYLEIRAGTGGDEAAIFAGDLYRMYGKFAEQMGWWVEILSAREGEPTPRNSWAFPTTERVRQQPPSLRAGAEQPARARGRGPRRARPAPWLR